VSRDRDKTEASGSETEAFKFMAEARPRRGVAQSRGGIKTEASIPRLHPCCCAVLNFCDAIHNGICIQRRSVRKLDLQNAIQVSIKAI